MMGRDLKEGAAAFLEKRPPRFPASLEHDIPAELPR